MAEPDVLEAPNILEYPYARSVGPIIGRFMAGLRDRRFLGIRAKDGHVICPPTEYDPETGEELGVDDLVEVGPNGEVTTWAWVSQPHGAPARPSLRLGAHRPRRRRHRAPARRRRRRRVAMRTGMRVTPRWREERVGDIHDIECFVPEEQ